MSGHSEGVEKGKFCALRKDKCPCGNEYQENCTPAPDDWTADDKFWQGSSMGVAKKFEAHHLLCVASVTEFIGKKPAIKKIVEQTDWCINDTTNMFAMPLWGHTIKHYCNLAEDGELLDKVKAPHFKNIPQHDYDHNSTGGYTSEVNKAMKNLARTVEEQATDKHEADAKKLKKKLDGLSNDFRSELQRRGSSRCNGTHKAWQKGSKYPESDWYLPFSMATDAIAEKRTFPASNFDNKLGQKILRLVKALGTWGAT